MCGAADAVKESVTAHNRASAAAAAAAAAAATATASAATAAAAIEDFLFSEGGYSERWLHECVIPLASQSSCCNAERRCVLDATQPLSYWCVHATCDDGQ